MATDGWGTGSVPFDVYGTSILPPGVTPSPTTPYRILFASEWPFGTIVRPTRGDNRRLLVLRDDPEGGWFHALVVNDDRGGVPGGFGSATLPPAIGHVGQNFPRRLWEPDD